MESLNFYDLLNALKIKKPTNSNSLEASMNLIRELTAIKAENNNAEKFKKK
jgi:hypothetical protein